MINTQIATIGVCIQADREAKNALHPDNFVHHVKNIFNTEKTNPPV